MIDPFALLVLCLALLCKATQHTISSTHLSLSRILYLRFAPARHYDFCRPVAFVMLLMASK